MLRRGLSFTRVAAGAVSSSLAFYLLTNLAVWYTWHPHTWADLVHCYALALPFFANTVASDLAFSAGFFGLYALAISFRPAPWPRPRRPKRNPLPRCFVAAIASY